MIDVDVASRGLPVGSIIFSVFALIIISLLVLVILRHYLPLRTTPAFYLVPLFFALWLPSVIVLLVPIDLASSAGTDDEATRGIWLPQRAILVAWRITYWLTFTLTWFLLPILGEYSDSGYREPEEKLKYSLRENAQFYAMVLGASILGLAYIFITYNFSFTALKGLIVALAYCWGLILAIYLMGHGLVSIPRHLIRDATLSTKLRRLQSKAPRLFEKMGDSATTVEELEAQIFELGRRKVGSAADFRDWIDDLQDIANITPSQPPRMASSHMSSDGRDRTVPTVITEKYLADLTRRFIRAKHSRSRYASEWNRLVQDATRTQSILDSGASKKIDFGEPSPHDGPWEKMRILSPFQRYLWYYHFVPYTELALGFFLAAASACIVWSEVVKFPFPKLSIIRVSVVHHWVGDKAEIGLAGQVISAFWICYMCAAALSSMTEVKVWRGRALVKRNTAYESAFWYACQVAKLTVPLAYNFLTFLSSEIYQKTTFYNFLGQLINLTPLGRWFDDLFPIFLLVPVFATLFGLYGRIKRLVVGIDLIEEEEEEGNNSAFGTGTWREGRNLIERELSGEAIRRRDELYGRLANAGSGASRGGAPILSVPAAAQDGASRSGGPSSMGVSTAGQPSQSRRRYTDDEPPEDESFLSLLGHRMKNTVDGIEAPKWFSDIGQGFKKPTWMGGNEQQSNTTTTSTNVNNNNPQRADGDIRRWFGGDGQIRL